ncbi:thiamine pyrophosphate-dependent enzyme [Natranaerofaba carboxydovora]|uniref:thiamine pyrophosphate-dependent enzyme n=1 Tax=Natranaerofaba carboxydovora TaxID=2742683 RepID=UPI003B847E16
MHYCPGCTHMTIHKILADTIDELGIKEEAIGVAPVGCAVLIYEYFDCDMVQAPHGRAPAVATGMKSANEDNMVFTYQGDGDLASIGTAEIIHSAVRGENLTTVFVNNAIYGMTGGQMAPTTLIEQITTTTTKGRNSKDHGYPYKISEQIANLDGASYVSRQSVHNKNAIENTKRAIKKAFVAQQNKEGFSLVEILSTCPTNWGLNPKQSIEWIEKNMLPIFQTGDLKTTD